MEYSKIFIGLIIIFLPTIIGLSHLKYVTIKAKKEKFVVIVTIVLQIIWIIGLYYGVIYIIKNAHWSH